MAGNYNKSYHYHPIKHTSTNTNTNTSTIQIYNVVEELQDYMFTTKNFERYTKDMFEINNHHDLQSSNPKLNSKVKPHQNLKSHPLNTSQVSQVTQVSDKKVYDNHYRPRQHDSLFWCFYILKYGFSKYEMEVGNQHFTIEKSEKFKYIDMLRKNKDILKINKIKPLSDLEDDLANKSRISIKTFFALCILEKLNILLVDKRKIYESINNDESEIHVIHRNSVTYEHHIELNILPEELSKIRNTYHKMTGFESTLKAMSSYKVDELLELCKKLGIDTSTSTSISKKLTKKDIYERIVQNF
jgi:hypothetical protein